MNTKECIWSVCADTCHVCRSFSRKAANTHIKGDLCAGEVHAQRGYWNEKWRKLISVLKSSLTKVAAAQNLSVYRARVSVICDTVPNNALGIERKQAQHYSPSFFEASIMSHCLYANAAVTVSEPLIRASFCCGANGPHSKGWGKGSGGIVMESGAGNLSTSLGRWICSRRAASSAETAAFTSG